MMTTSVCGPRLQGDLQIRGQKWGLQASDSRTFTGRLCWPDLPTPNPSSECTTSGFSRRGGNCCLSRLSTSRTARLSTPTRRNPVCRVSGRHDASVSSVAVSVEADVSRRRTTLIEVQESGVPSSLPQKYLTAGGLNHAAEEGAATDSERRSELPDGASVSGGLAGFFESKLSPRLRGLILLNMLTFLYGSNVTVVKEAQALLDPFSFSLGRFGIAALAFLPFLRPAFKSGPIMRAGLELGVWASIAYVTQAVGLLTCDAGRAAFIGTFTVIEVPIIAGIFGARIPSITWWSAAAAVLGVGLLESAGGNSSFVGDSWTIVSALLFGVHMLRSEHHTRHVPVDGALPLIALQLFVTAVMSMGWLIGMSHVGLVPPTVWQAVTSEDWTTVSSWPWLEMAYTGVLSTAFCLWVEVVSLRDVSASEAAMVYTLEPLYGAGFAWVLLGERWGPLGWVGASLILGGSVAMQLFGQVEVVDTEPEEIEVHKSSAAILGALGTAAAIALVMAAAGGAPNDSLQETLPEGLLSVEAVSWVEYGDVELENLAALMRAYAMVKGDAPTAAKSNGSSLPLTPPVD